MPPYTAWTLSGMNPYGKYTPAEFGAETQRQNVVLRDQIAREQLEQQQAQEAARSRRELQKMGLAQQQFARQASLAEQREERQRDALRAKLIESQQMRAREQSRYRSAQERYAAEREREQARYDAGEPLRAAKLRAAQLGIRGEEEAQARARRKEKQQDELVEVDFGQGPVMIPRKNFDMIRQIRAMRREEEKHKESMDWRDRTYEDAQQRYRDTREDQLQRREDAEAWKRREFNLGLWKINDQRERLWKAEQKAGRGAARIAAIPGELGERARAALDMAGGEFSRMPQAIQLEVMEYLGVIKPKTFAELDNLQQREAVLNHGKTARMQALYDDLADWMANVSGGLYPSGIAEDLAEDPGATEVVNNIAQQVKAYIEETRPNGMDLAALATAIADPGRDILRIIVPGYENLEIGRGGEGSRRDKIVQGVLGQAFGVGFKRTKRRELDKSFFKILLAHPMFGLDDQSRENLLGPKITGSSPSAKELRDQIKIMMEGR
ncbi:MAG: hypothetical protein CL793_06360 [Chloroflexi bacterium]|nr:hypothetical protein [Chloroflexota bacterium]